MVESNSFWDLDAWGDWWGRNVQPTVDSGLEVAQDFTAATTRRTGQFFEAAATDIEQNGGARTAGMLGGLGAGFFFWRWMTSEMTGIAGIFSWLLLPITMIAGGFMGISGAEWLTGDSPREPVRRGGERRQTEASVTLDGADVVAVGAMDRARREVAAVDTAIIYDDGREATWTPYDTGASGPGHFSRP